MEKRYDNLLTTRIEEVAHQGWAFIEWWEAYLWYGQEKLGRNFWRDLKSRFEELLPKEELQFRADNRGLLLVHSVEPISSKTGDE